MQADSRLVNTVGEPDAGNPQVRFDGGVVVSRPLASHEDAEHEGDHHDSRTRQESSISHGPRLSPTGPREQGRKPHCDVEGPRAGRYLRRVDHLSPLALTRRSLAHVGGGTHPVAVRLSTCVLDSSRRPRTFLS